MSEVQKTTANAPLLLSQASVHAKQIRERWEMLRLGS
jgi:hypothetical protein